MNDRDFWVQVRRGLIMVIDAIDQKFALNHIRADISAPAPLQTIGAARHHEPPQTAPARSSPERIGTDGV